MDKSATGKELENSMSDVMERLQRVTAKLQKARHTAAVEASISEPAGPEAKKPSAAGQGSLKLSASGWVERLQKAANELGSLKSGTEREFLSIGSGVQDFYGRALKISEMSASVVRELSGEETTAILDKLTAMSAGLNAALTRAENGTAGLLERLLEVSDEAAGLSLDTVAADRVCEIREKLYAGLAGAVSAVKNLQAKQSGRANAVIQSIDSSLETFASKREQSAALAGGVSSISRDISDAMGMVVESLQFHDITHQQIDHVRQGVLSLCMRLKTGAVPGSKTAGAVLENKELAGEVGAISETQAAQLSHASQELSAAVEAVKTSLKRISDSAVVLAEKTKELTSGEGETSNTFISEMSNLLASARFSLTELSESAGYRREVCTSMKKLAETSREISRMLGYRTKDEADGEPGVSGILGLLSSLDGLLEEYSCSGSGGLMDIGRASSDIGFMLNALRRSNGNMLYRLTLVENSGKTLSDEIASAAGSFNVHETVAKRTTGIRTLLEDIAAQARLAAPEEYERVRSEKMKALSFHTMLMERRASAGDDADDKAAAVVGRGSSFGDNVELF